MSRKNRRQGAPSLPAVSLSPTEAEPMAADKTVQVPAADEPAAEVPVSPIVAAMEAGTDILRSVVKSAESEAAKAAGDQWHVANSDGESGVVTATDASSAKYAFMRQHKICDRQQHWTVAKL